MSAATPLRLFSPSPSIAAMRDPLWAGSRGRRLGSLLVRDTESAVSPRGAVVNAPQSSVSTPVPTVPAVPNTKPSNVSYGDIAGIMMVGTDELSSYKTYVLNQLLYTEQLNGSQAEYDDYAAQIVAAADEPTAWALYLTAPAYATEYAVNNALIAQRNQGAQVTGNPSDLQFATTNNPNTYDLGIGLPPWLSAGTGPTPVFTSTKPPSGPSGNTMDAPIQSTTVDTTVTAPPSLNLTIPDSSTTDVVTGTGVTDAGNAVATTTTTPAITSNPDLSSLVEIPAAAATNWFTEDSLGFGFPNWEYLAVGFVAFLLLRSK